MAMPVPGGPGEVNLGMYHDPPRAPTIGQSTSSQGFNFSHGTTQQQSNTYIPEYSQTPILNEIAQYSRSMAPEVYQWGMNQFNKNQGNIDTMMRNALNYASPSRISSEVGKAEAGVQQGAEAGRQSAIKDLQSYGIDPSSGRYAALDQASRVSSAAAAAGAGNLQRDTVQKTAAEMQGQAMGLSQQNLQTGYGAAGAMTGLLNTGMQLKYSPLGTTSSGSSETTGGGATQSTSTPQAFAAGGDVDMTGYAPEGEMDDSTTGGFVSQELSPSAGSEVDDVQARLNAGEFVIPRDVAEWKGQEFFYKLMAQARKMRATAGQENGDDNAMPTTGYGADSSAQEQPSFG